MGLFGILAGLGLLVWLAYRGWSVLLLAPAAASFDQFTGYDDRGERFAAAVREWIEGGAQREHDDEHELDVVDEVGHLHRPAGDRVGEVAGHALADRLGLADVDHPAA